MMKKSLLIFTKNPEAGKVKTRLAAKIGNAKAFSIYKQLIEYTVSITNYLPVDKFIFFSNDLEQKDLWNDKHFFKQVQCGQDLGERMNNAFAFAFEMKYDMAVIIGTDCPELNAGIIMNAFAYLNTYDVVIGPAEDGGYYLLGMNQLYSQLFKNISWSTQSVFEETLSICKKNNISYSLLPVLLGVDEEKDLLPLKNENV